VPTDTCLFQYSFKSGLLSRSTLHVTRGRHPAADDPAVAPVPGRSAAEAVQPRGALLTASLLESTFSLLLSESTSGSVLQWPGSPASGGWCLPPAGAGTSDSGTAPHSGLVQVLVVLSPGQTKILFTASSLTKRPTRFFSYFANFNG
jgi:hypothetical protein